MSMNTRDGILGLKARERRIVKVDIKGFGTFNMREWRGSDRESYWKLTKDMESYRQGVVGVALSLVNDEGDMLFMTSDEDIAVLMELPMAVLDELAVKAIELNSIDSTVLEDTEKNS